MRRALLFGLMVSALVLVGCGERVTRCRLVGHYFADPGSGEEDLELRDDGGYTQRLTVAKSDQVVATGKWEFTRGEVIIRDFRPGPAFTTRADVRKDWRLTPEEDWGMIRLHVSREPREFYLGAPRARAKNDESELQQKCESLDRSK